MAGISHHDLEAQPEKCSRSQRQVVLLSMHHEHDTHVSQRQILHVWTCKLLRHSCMWERNVKKMTKPRNITDVIINHYFLSTCSGQTLLKPRKTRVLREISNKERKVYGNHLEGQCTTYVTRLEYSGVPDDHARTLCY